MVDGTFTNSEETDVVRLSYAVDYGEQTFLSVENANLIIYDDAGQSENLVETEAGVYEFQKNIVRGEVGKTYYLEIVLEDGRTYHSNREMLQAAPVIDSFSYEIKNIEYANDFGSLVSSFNFNLFVESTINTEKNTNLLRWEVEHIYAFEKPFLYYLPPDICYICYVEEILNPQIINIFDGRNFAPVSSIKEQIATKVMDYTFAFPQSYRVAQYNISEPAYDYWSNINKISNQIGDIFDAPPAYVQGNINRIDDSSETVLGYFSVAGVDYATIFITEGDVVEQYKPRPYCGIEPRSPSDQLVPACYNCLIIENSSKKRPDYW